MKNSRICAIVAAVLLSVAPRVYAACSNATVAGRYGFTTTGTLFLPGPAPVAAAGSITFDLNGSASGSQDRSVAGIFAHETIQGTYTINSHCALRLIADVYDDSGALVRSSVIDGVVVDNGKQIRGMFESVTLPNGAPVASVLTVEAIRVQGHAQ